MKLKSTLASGLIGVAAVLSLNANAASGTAADIKMEKIDTQKQVKPHSHMEEKMGRGMKPHAEQATLAKTNPWLDKTRHFHPRDGGK